MEAMEDTRRSISLNGHTYELGKLPGMKAFRLLNRLTRIFAPAAARAADGMVGGGLADMDLGKLAEGLTSLFASLSEDEQEAITRLLLFDCTRDGAPLMQRFDLVMRGDLLSVISLLKFAIEVNFEDFIPALLARFQRPGAGASSKESMISDPSGPVGG